MMALHIFLSALLATSGPQAGDRIPAPEESAQKQAEKLVKDLFKEDYAKKTPKDKASLGDKMLEQARQAKDDPPSQYVLFREAQDLLAQAGEADRCFLAIDEWTAIFAVDALDLKSRALAAVVKMPKTPDEMKTLTLTHLKLVDAAIAGDQYELADKTMQATLAAARKSNNPSMLGKATGKAKEVSELKGRYERVRKAKETLKASPDDGPANFVVGQFECLVKGNWEVGLPMLSKGAQEPLAATARKELESPGDGPGQSALADQWWELAEKETGSTKKHLRERAIYWYEKASAQLTGLGKTKVDRRLTDYRMEKVHRGSWLDLSDPKLYGKTGALGTAMVIDRQQSLKLVKPPTGEFDGYSVKVKLLSKDAVPNVQHEPGRYMVLLGAVSQKWTVSMHDGTGWVTIKTGDLPKLEEWTVTVLLEGEEEVVYVEGTEVNRRHTASDKLPSPYLIMHEGRASFSQMKLRKKE